MVARRLVTHISNTNNIIQMHTDFVHNTKTPLPQGNWLISVIKGDAWLFSPNNNTVLRTGDMIRVDNKDGQVVIRSLYTRGVTKYTIVGVD
jgi:uncharacterized protein with PhoU and TrkA domain